MPARSTLPLCLMRNLTWHLTWRGRGARAQLSVNGTDWKSREAGKVHVKANVPASV